MYDDTKVWWHSKTLWVNALAAGLIAAEAVSGALQPRLPVDLYLAVATALPIVNAILRVVTTQALTLTK